MALMKRGPRMVSALIAEPLTGDAGNAGQEPFTVPSIRVIWVIRGSPN